MSVLSFRSDWKDSFYPEKTAKRWVNSFLARYPRATDFLMEFCGKTTEEVIKMAQLSQTGWELFKFIVKSLNTIDSKYTDETREFFLTTYEADMENTIHMCSRMEGYKVRILEKSYIREFDYLTVWYKNLVSFSSDVATRKV